MVEAPMVEREREKESSGIPGGTEPQCGGAHAQPSPPAPTAEKNASDISGP